MDKQNSITDKQNKNTHFVIRTSDDFKKTYKDYCDLNGYSLSKRIIALLIKDLNENKM